MIGTNTQVLKRSPCLEQLFLSGLCLESSVTQQLVDFCCVKIHYFVCYICFWWRHDLRQLCEICA